MSMVSRSGDDGNTRLFGGRRVPKDTERLEAIGALEELNATLGVVLARHRSLAGAEALTRIQSELLDLVAEMGTPRDPSQDPGNRGFPTAALDAVDRDLADAEGLCGPLVAVLRPGGDEAAAWLHLARAQCRRAERRAVTVARHERVPGVILAYLNRLGDLLFLLARAANQRAGVRDPEWITRDERDAEE